MSVPLHRRSENKLDAYVKTLAMVKYKGNAYKAIKEIDDMINKAIE